MEKIKGYLKNILRIDSRPIPYFAEYDLGNNIPLTLSISIEKYPGLLSYHFVRSNRGPIRLATYWSTEAHFNLHKLMFESDICNNSITMDGVIYKPTIQAEPLWKRVRLYTLVLHLAALLGALQLLENHYDLIFRSPQLVLRSVKTRIDIIERAEFQEIVSLFNHLPIAHRDIIISASLNSASTKEKELVVLPNSIPYLGAGISRELVVSGVATVPGAYQLVLNAQAEAGLIRPINDFKLELPAIVWPKTPKGSLSLKSVKGDTALLSGEIAVGPPAPKGLDCELEIIGIAGLEYAELFEFSMLAEDPSWRTSGKIGDAVASLWWGVLPVAGRERLRFQVALRGPVSFDWKRIEQCGTIKCYYRKGEIGHAR